MGDRNLQALNRAFTKAFEHNATEETLTGFLQHLGEEFSCDRISIFEFHDETFVDNTYEWCREGVVSEINLLQHLSVIGKSTWGKRLLRDEIICIERIEDIRLSDPAIYKLFQQQAVDCVIAFKLAFHGKFFGFCVLENPSDEVMRDLLELMPGMRYILSSLLYSDHLLRRFQKLGYSDSLTGAGNRLLLQERLEQMNRNQSVGFIYCDVFEWNVDDGRPEHLEEQQMLIHTSTVLQNLFDVSDVFRVGTGEFLVICPGIGEAEFTETTQILRKLFLGQDLAVAVGTDWSECCEDSCDAMIRRAHMMLFEEKRKMVQERRERHAPFQAVAVREEAEIREVDALRSFQESADIRLYRGDRFFEQADIWMSQIFDENIVTAVVDINYFKLYNDIFGRSAGNVFLESIAENCQRVAREHDGIAGYLGGDNFCIMFPTMVKEPGNLRPILEEMIHELEYTDGFAPVFGIYLSVDRQETSIVCYDHALIALSEIKGSYTEHIRIYNRDHFEDIRNSKILLMDAKEGVKRGEFFFQVQPQVHERTGKVIGGEALMRWNYKGQVVAPGLFIDIMENSGYIFTLDSCIWEQVCAWLADLVKRGIKPVPITVNVSRVDFYFTDIAEHFISLVKRYQVDPELLGIEITETAFTDNMETIHESIRKLHEAGFHILMDDFGSGSSSLSMLHQMNVDILKTDVNFMSQSSLDNKAISIVESIISMAHMMGMLVITEGVETAQQRDKLIALGDNYAQGFFFYRAMPIEDFEKLLTDPAKVGEPPKRGNALLMNRLHFREMLHEGMLSDTLLDNIIGPAAVIRRTGEEIHVVQINHRFQTLTGILPEEEGGKADLGTVFEGLGEKTIAQAILSADDHPLEGISGEILLKGQDEKERKLKARLFLLYGYNDHMLYMVTLQE